jgi:hypothetical protein
MQFCTTKSPATTVITLSLSRLADPGNGPTSTACAYYMCTGEPRARGLRVFMFQKRVHALFLARESPPASAPRQARQVSVARGGMRLLGCILLSCLTS